MANLQAEKTKELKGCFKGEILLPSDGAYESARKIWNAMIDKRPAVITRCATTSDVRLDSLARSSYNLVLIPKITLNRACRCCFRPKGPGNSSSTNPTV